jgi:Transposase DDE domain
MPDASQHPIDHFPAVLARLPPGIDLEQLGRETGSFLRPRGIRSAADCLRLTLAWGPGGYSMQRVAAWAGEQGIARLTEDALVQRLHKAVPYLQALVSRLLAPGEAAACWHGRSLRIADSSSLSRPASKGTDWRIHGVYDLAKGGFSHLDITDGRGGEALDRGQSAAGEIRIADRGYANAPAWHRFVQASNGTADFIVRMRWSTVRLQDEAAAPFDLIAWLQALPRDGDLHQVCVWVRPNSGQPPMKIRLIARRKPDHIIAAEHQRLRQRASRKQSKLDPRSLIAAAYLMLATSLHGELFPAEQVLQAYRLRWQIELAFKRLKSLLHIDRLRTKTEAGTRCWLYAHLIVALLADDLSQDVLESFPSAAH